MDRVYSPLFPNIPSSLNAPCSQTVTDHFLPRLFHLFPPLFKPLLAHHPVSIVLAFFHPRLVKGIHAIEESCKHGCDLEEIKQLAHMVGVYGRNAESHVGSL